MKEKISLSLLLLFSFWVLLAGASPCSAMESQVQIPVSQFTTLKNNNTRLLLKLTELETSLETLDNQSDQLTEQLNVAKKQLQQSQQELTSARVSLENVEALQKQTSASLQSLEVQLELERKQQKDQVNRLKRQRNLYALLLCSLLIK